MHRALHLALLLLLAACGRKQVDLGPDWTSTPHLPSPRAGGYARTPQTPPDPVVAALVRDLRWDASLAGAAAGVALAAVRGEGTLEAWAVREAAWQAGYAYPVRDVAAWTVPYQAPAPEALRDWLAGLGEGADVGLVRARTSADDAWVALVAYPRADLGPIPRKVHLGGSIGLPALPDAVLRVADADGHLREQPLDDGARVVLDREGEWLVQVIDRQGEVARFPVYAGIDPPAAPLFRVRKQAPVRTAADLEARAESQLLAVRQVYGEAPWRRSARLDAAARTVRDAPERAPLEVVGFDALTVWRCTGRSTEECLDALVWEPEHRAALLAPGGRIGLAGQVTGGRAALIVVLDRGRDTASTSSDR